MISQLDIVQSQGELAILGRSRSFWTWRPGHRPTNLGLGEKSELVSVYKAWVLSSGRYFTGHEGFCCRNMLTDSYSVSRGRIVDLKYEYTMANDALDVYIMQTNSQTRWITNVISPMTLSPSAGHSVNNTNRNGRNETRRRSHQRSDFGALKSSECVLRVCYRKIDRVSSPPNHSPQIINIIWVDTYYRSDGRIAHQIWEFIWSPDWPFATLG